MNKQQLATRIWKSANQMRSKIDAAEYKDYILGFIFYKYLSEREVEFLRSNAWEDSDISELTEEDPKDVKWIQNNLGYFIAHENLYDSWIDKGADFDVTDVADGLSAFERNISETNRHVFSGIFKTLSLGLTKLGDSTQHQTRAIHELLMLIRPIPMGENVDYDMLGFIYEYLINQFAANAGKKAGEFYTPHEVSKLMAEIIADHLEGRETISVYDCAAGSASLLLTIGEAVARRSGNPSKIRYFAQELKQSTYNLSRMNLVMRGIAASNIKVKNADTLIDDWPLDENEIDPLRVDATCLNPPYSQKWTKPLDADPRFSYGLAPESKADYAFLEHSLYHLAPGGIMCIVLPHGVLFRGSEEETIRRNLLDQGHVSAVIGLPADIFYGTGIPTIVMVLKKDPSTDKSVLFIDGSHGFAKEGKKNKLKACDIKRIFDSYKSRSDIAGFAHLASFDEIERNGFNLNIPRYVDSSEPSEQIDIYASMFGGVPSAEIDLLSDYWDAWPTLRPRLFAEADGYAAGCGDVEGALAGDESAARWHKTFDEALGDWPQLLEETLLSDPEGVDADAAFEELAGELFERMDTVALADPYAAYQTLADAWETISADLEAIKADGLLCAMRAVDPHMVEPSKEKLKKGITEEQDKKEPWAGRTLPFALVQRILMPDELEALAAAQAEASSLADALSSAVEDIADPETREAVTKEDGSTLDADAAKTHLAENLSSELPELKALEGYLGLAKGKAGKAALAAFSSEHPECDWGAMRPSKSGSYTQAEVRSRIKAVASAAEKSLPAGSALAPVAVAVRLADERKAADKKAKDLAAQLTAATKERIEGISESEGRRVLHAKWVESLDEGVRSQKGAILAAFTAKANALARKYETTLSDVESQIAEASSGLAAMLGQLTGSERDMEGLSELKRLLGGDIDG